MRKIALSAFCALMLCNCKEQLPTDSEIGKGNPSLLDDQVSSGSIEIEPADLSTLRKAHALAKASGLPIKSVIAQEVMAKYLAKALAASLSEPEIRKVLKREIGAKFDGDYNVLWSRIKLLPANGNNIESRIRRNFSSSAQSSGIMEMFDDFRRLQIAIPKNFDKWDGAGPILVACVPFTKDDLNTDFLYAYDLNLKEHKLDGKKIPEYPVIVVSRNERTNNNEELLGDLFTDAGNGSLIPLEAQIPSTVSPLPLGEQKTGYPENKMAIPSLMKKSAIFAVTPKVPLYWDKVIVYSDLEGWFMGGMEVRMHLLTDKEVALTAQKNGVYEDNNYNVGSFLRNINEDISRYIGTKLTEIDDNDWDKNFTFKLSADVAKMVKGEDELTGNAKGEIAYNFGGDTDDDYIGENNKIELGAQDVSTTWTAGMAKIKFNYDPGVVEYDVSAMPFVSASGTLGRGNQWNVESYDGGAFQDGEDVAYRLIVPQGETNTYKFSTCSDLTNFDTAIQIFDKSQATPYMNDDDYSCAYNIRHSTVTAQLSGGTYYIVVDGFAGYTGSYKLTVSKL